LTKKEAAPMSNGSGRWFRWGSRWISQSWPVRLGRRPRLPQNWRRLP